MLINTSNNSLHQFVPIDLFEVVDNKLEQKWQVGFTEAGGFVIGYPQLVIDNNVIKLLEFEQDAVNTFKEYVVFVEYKDFLMQIDTFLTTINEEQKVALLKTTHTQINENWILKNSSLLKVLGELFLYIKENDLIQNLTVFTQELEDIKKKLEQKLLEDFSVYL